jgi:hypothetical protein
VRCSKSAKVAVLLRQFGSENHGTPLRRSTSFAPKAPDYEGSHKPPAARAQFTPTPISAFASHERPCEQSVESMFQKFTNRPVKQLTEIIPFFS